MRGFALSVLAVAGCSQILGIGDFKNSSSDGGSGDDGGGSGMCSSFSTIVDTCAYIGSAQLVAITEVPATFDTDTGELHQNGLLTDVTVVMPGSDTTTFIVATTFSISASVTLSVTGSRAFGVIATDAISIEGMLDGGSHVSPASAGGGSRTATECGSAAGGSGTTEVVGTTQGTGGAGGGFFGSGGSGGGDVLDDNTDPGGLGGAGSMICPTTPIGGCPGGAGGLGEADTQVAPGGAGGGAVYLASAISVTISANAWISAGGAGGAGGLSGDVGADGGGGAGGGAGGMIMIESSAIDVDGTLAANGGGGGQGGMMTTGASGGDGSASDQRALGGTSATAATVGAPGGAGGALAGGHPTANNTIAGGGAGGGVGFIRLTTQKQTGGGIISPTQCP